MDRVDSKQDILGDREDGTLPESPHLPTANMNAKEDQNDEMMKMEENLIIEQNITDLSEDERCNVASDLCEALQPAEPLSIIVGDGSASLTSEDSSVWTSTTQDLALSGSFIYHCSDNSYKITTCTEPLTTAKPDTEVYTCDVTGCTSQFNTPGYLKIHQLVHTGNRSRLVCPYEGCGRTFSWPAHLKYHQMTHSGKRSYTCSYLGCGKSFYTSQRLAVHTRLHTGERPFICQVDGCKKSFTTAGNLKNHSRVHSGEKPFVCDVEGCNKRFAEYSSLRKHKVIHSGEKPFHCELCGQPFTQSGSRNVHIKRYHSKLAAVLPGGSTADGQPVQSATTESSSSSAVITSSDVTHFVTVATDSIIGVTTECVTRTTDQIDGPTDNIQHVIDSEDYNKSTLIIMTDGHQQDLQYSDEVVSVSTQPISINYQDTMNQTDTMLSTHGDEDFEKVIVKKEVANPEVTLSSFC